MKHLTYFFAICLVFSALQASSQNPLQVMIDLIPPFPEHLYGPPPQGKVLGPGLFNHIPPVREAYHDGTERYAGHTPNGELYFRTTDSTQHIVAKPNKGWRWDIADALWSPDGKYLLARQVDDSAVPRISLTKEDTVVQWPYSRAGEPLPKMQYYIVTTATGEATPIQHGQTKPYVHALSWSADGSELRMARADRLMKTLELLRVSPETGETEVWLSESADTYLLGLYLLQGYTGRLRRSNVFYFLDDREQVIYTSERSGYYQLYLHDKNGDLIRPLTNYEQNGLVSFLASVDPVEGYAYFVGQGDHENPQNQQVYRSSLNEQHIEKLIDGPTIMEVLLTETRDSLWVWRNDMDKFSTLEIIDTSGKMRSTYWSADMSPLAEIGLKPEIVPMLASDGKVTIDAMVFKPKNFNPDAKYPVVEWIYGAAHTAAINRTIISPSHYELQNLANQGFIVVIIDGRGTPGRGEKFRNLSYGKFGLLEMADHVHVLQQLASKRPYMDLDKLGIAGHSWGGHYALRAVVEHPDFYKAAHLSAPAIDPANFRVAIEAYMGCLPAECPEAYEQSALTPKLHRLKAPLLINHGTADDDVPIDDAYYLIKELKRINYENFELVEFPGMDHIIMKNPQWEKGLISFFVEQFGEKREGE